MAYGMTAKENIPETTTRCNLFWRFVVMTFLAWPLFGLFLLVTAGLMIAVAFLILGYKLNKNRSTLEDFFVPINHLPKIRGHFLYPWELWIVLILAALLYNYWYSMISALGRFWDGLSRFWNMAVLTAQTSIFGFALVSVILIFLLVAIAKKVRKTEVWKLFSGYMGDEYKRRFCPIIPIEQLPKPEEQVLKYKPEEVLKETPVAISSFEEKLEKELISLKAEAEEEGLSLSWVLQ